MSATAPSRMPPRELRCGGCRRLLGTTTRPQAVPVQCLDPFCAASPLPSSNEERDSFMEHLYGAGWSLVELGDLFGLTRQRVGQLLSSREVI